VSAKHPPPFNNPQTGVLDEARRLWGAGQCGDARALIQAALSKNVTSDALRTAAWAYSEAFTQPLAGRRVSLVRRSPADLTLVRAAWADRPFMARFHRMAPPLPADDTTLAQVLGREAQATLLDAKNLHWTVVRADGQRVGMVSMVEVQLRHRRAEFVVGVRDDTPGLALEASLLALEFAFRVMRLHKVCSSVYGQNEYALRSTVHLGFKREGTLRDHLYDLATGQWVSLHLSALFKDDFLCAANQRLAQRLLKRPLSA
jgi:RimJ/RimL family protein N-acetyltransferase